MGRRPRDLLFSVLLTHERREKRHGHGALPPTPWLLHFQGKPTAIQEQMCPYIFGALTVPPFAILQHGFLQGTAPHQTTPFCLGDDIAIWFGIRSPALGAHLVHFCFEAVNLTWKTVEHLQRAVTHYASTLV